MIIGLGHGIDILLHFLVIWLDFSQLKQKKTPHSFLWDGGCDLEIGAIKARKIFSFLIKLIILWFGIFQWFAYDFLYALKFFLV